MHTVSLQVGELPSEMHYIRGLCNGALFVKSAFLQRQSRLRPYTLQVFLPITHKYSVTDAQHALAANAVGQSALFVSSAISAQQVPVVGSLTIS